MVWMMVCHITPCGGDLVQALPTTRPRSISCAAAMPSGVPHSGRPPIVPASMKVFSRWIELMPMIAIASFTFSTLALTWLSHSGWSGWPSRFSRDTKVS